MRLIDADAKIMAQFYDDEHEDWIVKEITVADYLSFSDTPIPFVDAIPVVRCGECKYYFGGGLGICEMIKSRLAACQRDVRWNDEFYCAFGERKEGADE